MRGRTLRGWDSACETGRDRNKPLRLFMYLNHIMDPQIYISYMDGSKRREPHE